MKKKNLGIALVGLILAGIAAYFILTRPGFVYKEQVLLPTDVYEVFPVTDSIVGGFSTSELNLSDSAVTSYINVRSGTSYPYAGMGVNLLSVRHRPAAGFFDFTAYDSVAVDVSSDRLRTVEIRILNNDPVYSVDGNILSYRPQVKTIPANGLTKLSLSDFKTPEWWLAAVGLDEDDLLSYFDRGVIVAVINGEGAMRGIPDKIQVKSIKFWNGASK